VAAKQWPPSAAWGVIDSVGLFMRGIVPGRPQPCKARARSPVLCLTVLSDQQSKGVTTDRCPAKISRLRATSKPVAISRFGFAACQDAIDQLRMLDQADVDGRS
jgi:hypothetical protein